MKIRGNTVGTTMKRPDFNQTDERKSDYIKNNPIPAINEGDEGKIPVVKDGAYALEDCIKPIHSEINEMSEAIGNADTQIKGLGETVASHGESISTMGEKIDNAKSRLDELEGGYESVNAAINTIREETIPAIKGSIPEVREGVYDFGEEGPSNTATVSQRGILIELASCEDKLMQQIYQATKGSYVLLEEFTTTEEMTAYYYRTNEHNRSHLKAALVRMEIEAGVATGQINFNFRNGTTDLCRTSTQAIATSKRYYIFEAFKDYNKWTATRRGGSTAYEQAIYSWVNVPVITESNIDVIYISAQTTGVPIPIGTKISIYGAEE